MEYFRINPQLLPAKMGCFLGAAYLGSFAAILNVFFVSVDLTEVEAGMLTAMMYSSCIFTGPLWGYLADYTKRRTLILIILCTGAGLTISVLPWTAYGLHEISGAESIGESLKQKNAWSIWFFVLSAIMVTASAFVLPLMAYFEGIVANVAKIYGAPYGGQRVFGEIGIASSSMLTGVICDHFKMKGMSEYTPAFILFATICLAMLPTGRHLIQQIQRGSPKDTETSADQGNGNSFQESVQIEQCAQPEQIKEEIVLQVLPGTETPTGEDSQNPSDIPKSCESSPDIDTECPPSQEADSLLKKTARLCSKPSVILFLLTVFVSGVANALFLGFTFKYLIDEMKRSKFESSLAFASQPITSCISFILADKFIKVFRGTLPTMAVSLLVISVRLLIMSFRIPFEVFLGLCLLQGFSFAAFYSSMMEHIISISPKEITMTMTQISLALFFYVGSLVGNIGGSQVYSRYGGRTLFLGQAIVCGAWAVVLLLVYFLGMRRSTNRPQTVSNDQY